MPPQEPQHREPRPPHAANLAERASAPGRRARSDAPRLEGVPVGGTTPSPKPGFGVEAGVKPAVKPSRRTPDNQTRLYMNVGSEMEILPIDVVNTIVGETGLPGKVVGTVDVRERHLFADVASEHANSIIAKLNRTQIKGHKVKVKVA